MAPGFSTEKKLLLLLAALALAAAAFFLLPRLVGRAPADQAMLHEEKEYLILIMVDEKKLYLLNYGQVEHVYTVATGMWDYPTPVGDWEIVHKSRNWGDGFGARWLGLNVLWGTYGIHGTNDEGRIGQSVSHGCIRMRDRDVIELYDLVSVGTPVIIRNGQYGPFGTGFRTLIPGDRGSDVLAVERRLAELGYYTYGESGVYGDGLKEAVQRFQKDNNLPVDNEITRDDYVAMGFSEFE
jgi:hypothetical protein